MNRDIRATFTATDRTRAAARSASRNVRSVGESYNRLVTAASAANAAIAAVTLSVGGSSAIKTLAGLQAGITRLSSVTQTLTADQALLRQQSNLLSVDIEAATALFGRLRNLQNSGVLTSSDVPRTFQGLSDAFARFGAGAAQQENVIYGLAQALGQGQLQAAELNQVVEPLPGLLNDIAAAAGTSAAGFRKLVKNGEITSEVFGGLVLEAFRKYEGAAAALGGNITQILTRLSNAYKNTLLAFDAPVTAGIADFADTLTRGLNFLQANVEGTVEAVKLLGGALLAAFAARRVQPLVAGASTAIGSLRQVVAAENTARRAQELRSVAAAGQARQERLVAVQRERDAARAGIREAARARQAQEAALARQSAVVAAARAEERTLGAGAARARDQAVEGERRLAAAVSARGQAYQDLGRRLQSARTDASLAAANAANLRQERDRATALRNIAKANVEAATSTAKRAEKQRVLTRRTQELRALEGQVSTAERAQRAAQENRDRLAGLARINAAGRDDLELTRRRTAVSDEYRTAQERVRTSQREVAAATRESQSASRAYAAEQERARVAQESRVQSARELRAQQQRLNAAREAEAAAQARVNAATRAQTQARAAAAAATDRQTAAVGRLTLAYRALATAGVASAGLLARGFGNLFAALGGWTTAVVAAGFGLYTLYRRFNETNPVVEEASRYIEQLARETRALIEPAYDLAKGSETMTLALQKEIAALRDRNVEIGRGAVAIENATGKLDAFVAVLFAAATSMSGIEIIQAFKNTKQIDDATAKIQELTDAERARAAARRIVANRTPDLEAAYSAKRVQDAKDEAAAREKLVDLGRRIARQNQGERGELDALIQKRKDLVAAYSTREGSLLIEGYGRALTVLDEKISKARQNLSGLADLSTARADFSRLFIGLQDADAARIDPFAGLAQRYRDQQAEITALALEAQVSEQERIEALALAERAYDAQVKTLRQERLDEYRRQQEEEVAARQASLDRIAQLEQSATNARIAALRVVDPVLGVEENFKEQVRRLNARAATEIRIAENKGLLLKQLEIQAQQELEAAKTEIARAEAEKRAEVQKVAAVNVAAQVFGNLAQAGKKEVGSFIQITKEMTAAEREAAERSNKTNKKRFEDNKKLQRASALINALAGFNAALAQGGWLGFGQALTVLSSGLASLRRINNTQYGGGGSGAGVGALGGGGSAVSPTLEDYVPGAEEEQGVTYNITLVSADELIDPNVLQRRVEDAVDRSSRARRLGVGDGGRISTSTERVF